MSSAHNWRLDSPRQPTSAQSGPASPLRVNLGTVFPATRLPRLHFRNARPNMSARFAIRRRRVGICASRDSWPMRAALPLRRLRIGRGHRRTGFARGDTGTGAKSELSAVLRSLRWAAQIQTRWVPSAAKAALPAAKPTKCHRWNTHDPRFTPARADPGRLAWRLHVKSGSRGPARTRGPPYRLSFITRPAAPCCPRL